MLSMAISLRQLDPQIPRKVRSTVTPVANWVRETLAVFHMLPWSPDFSQSFMPFTKTCRLPIASPYMWYWNVKTVGPISVSADVLKSAKSSCCLGDELSMNM